MTVQTCTASPPPVTSCRQRDCDVKQRCRRNPELFLGRPGRSWKFIRKHKHSILTAHYRAPERVYIVHCWFMTNNFLSHVQFPDNFSLCGYSKPRRLGSSLSPQSRGQERISQVPETLHLLRPGENCWEAHPFLNTKR